MKCFYHSADLDGHCSGAIVKMAEPECEMFPINYGQPFPWDQIRTGEVVMMVDFSLQPFADMIRLNELATLVWIDHHKTALDDAAASGVRIDGIQREGLGACALVWEWMHRGETMPYSVRLLAEYDVGAHHDANCLPFQYGLRLESTWPDSEVWRRLLRPGSGIVYMADILRRGDIALRVENTLGECERLKEAVRWFLECAELKLRFKVWFVTEPEELEARATYQAALKAVEELL